MRRLFPPALAILVVSLYGALGWQQIVAGNRLVAPSSGSPAEYRQPALPYRFSFERGGRKCAMPTWHG